MPTGTEHKQGGTERRKQGGTEHKQGGAGRKSRDGPCFSGSTNTLSMKRAG